MSDKDENIGIHFTTDDGEEYEFYIVEDTMLNGISYLLVTDSLDDEANAYILKQTSTDGKEATYEIVTDNTELNAVGSVFNELLEDVDIIDATDE